MVGHEPAHLMGVATACPRPGCFSLNVKWRYYNNHKRSQPRYRCLGCKKYFTVGGKLQQPKKEKRSTLVRAAVKNKGPRIKVMPAAKIRQTKEEQQSAPREDHAGGAAVKKKGLGLKITPAESDASSYRRPVKELRIVMEPRSMKSKISSPNYLSVQPASPISKPKRLRRGRGPFGLSNCISNSETDSSSDEEYQADAGADMNSPLLHSNGTAISPPEISSVEKNQEDGSPAFSWTRSEQLRGPIVRSVGPSEPELLDWEEELLLVDTGLSGLTPWVDIPME